MSTRMQRAVKYLALGQERSKGWDASVALALVWRVTDPTDGRGPYCSNMWWDNGALTKLGSDHTGNPRTPGYRQDGLTGGGGERSYGFGSLLKARDWFTKGEARTLDDLGFIITLQVTRADLVEVGESGKQLTFERRFVRALDTLPMIALHTRRAERMAGDWLAALVEGGVEIKEV